MDHADRPEGRQSVGHADRPEGRQGVGHADRPEGRQGVGHADRPEGRQGVDHADRPEGRQGVDHADRPEGRQRVDHTDSGDYADPPEKSLQADGVAGKVEDEEDEGDGEQHLEGLALHLAGPAARRLRVADGEVQFTGVTQVTVHHLHRHTLHTNIIIMMVVIMKTVRRGNRRRKRRGGW